jgi:hypothetical protein
MEGLWLVWWAVWIESGSCSGGVVELECIGAQNLQPKTSPASTFFHGRPHPKKTCKSPTFHTLTT